MYINLFAALFFLCSRGIFELAAGKALAYIFSTAGFLLFIFLFYRSTKATIYSNGVVACAAGFFIFFGLLSALCSLFRGMDGTYLVYLIYPIFISASFFVFFVTDFSKLDRDKLVRTVSVLACVLFTFGTVQQVGLIKLPGDSDTFGLFVRPSSVTGSFLHYPLIMVLLGAFVHGLRNRMTWPVVIAYSSVFVAFSRSGMMLVLIILSLIVAHRLIASKIVFRLRTVIFFLVLMTLVIVIAPQVELLTYIIERMFSAIDTSSAGNTDRIEAWNIGISLFMKTNMLIGEYFGRVTNLTSNFSAADSFVVESGLLQTLLNFGIIGATIFYLFFLLMYKKSKLRILKYFIFAFFCQSFVYQSIEVLPFIIGTFLLLSIAKDHPITDNHRQNKMMKAPMAGNLL